MDGFERAGLEERKEEVMLEAVASCTDDGDNPFAALLERSAENQKKILNLLEQLADVLDGTGDFVAGQTKAIEAMTRAEELRSDLDARTQYLNSLNQAPMSIKIFLAPMEDA